MSDIRDLLAELATRTPFIPELHTDDCDDVDCTRCVDQPRIAALDVPPEQVAAEAILRVSLARHAALGNEDEVVADAEAIRLVTHPDAPVATDETYPEWAAALAARTHPGGQA